MDEPHIIGTGTAAELENFWPAGVSSYVMAPSHYGPEKHQVTRCSDCGMIYTNPPFEPYIKEGVEDRGALSSDFAEGKVDHLRRAAAVELKLVARYVPGGALLDFGCGAGTLVKVAIEQGWNAVGYDLNSGLIKAANEFWQFNALHCAPFDQFCADYRQRFDAIMSSQVFEHIPQPLTVARKLLEVLKPGGVLYIDVPYVFQPAEWLSRGRTLDPTAHSCHFSKKTLQELMKRLGLNVLYCSAAPSLSGLYSRFGLRRRLNANLGVLTKSILPPIGTGVCVIGRKPS